MRSFLLGFILSVAVTLGVLYWAVFQYLPTPEKIKGCLTTEMYKVYLCPGSETYVPLNQISVYFQKAVLLTEDSAFYQHRGFDWTAIEKNAREGWESGVFKKGGSTITQQFAKNVFLTPERTFIRKAREALITYEIEKVLSKNEILERYFNVIEFGKDIYGIKAAAQFYFKKDPKNLNITESAFLAMLLPNPKKYSSSYHKKELTQFARKRIGQIIENMYLYKRISSEEYEQAQTELAHFLTPTPSYQEAPTEQDMDSVYEEEDVSAPTPSEPVGPVAEPAEEAPQSEEPQEEVIQE